MSAETGTGGSRMQCEICDNDIVFRWSDTHGVGVCWKCSAPYTVYHYDENKKRLDKPPELALSEPGAALAKRYWSETGGKVFPGCFDVGFLGGRETTYSGASQSDVNQFNEWYRQQPEAAK